MKTRIEASNTVLQILKVNLIFLNINLNSYTDYIHSFKPKIVRNRWQRYDSQILEVRWGNAGCDCRAAMVRLPWPDFGRAMRGGLKKWRWL